MISTTKKYNSKIDSNPIMICKDHLVSGEEFQIVDYEFGILKTYPVPKNLSKYYESEDYISHSDSKESLQDKIYQFVKSYMLAKKTNWIRRYLKQGSVLDIGAGTGEFLSKMQSIGWHVEGVEPNQVARNLGNSKGLRLKEELSDLNGNKFQVISLWHVLEHLPDLEEKIDQLYNLLEEDGILIVAVPNYRSYDAKYYEKHWAAWDVPRHLWHFSRKGIREKFSRHQFQLINEKPLLFDSYYVSLLSERQKKTGHNILNAIFRGWLSNFKARSSGEYSSVTYFFKKSSKT